MASPSYDEAIDWDELAQKPARFSLGLLSQHSASGIDPYTVQIGQIIGKQFKLSVHSQRSVGNVLGNLAVYGVPHDSALKPGIGLTSVIRNSGFVDPAYELIALCGTLLEFFSEHEAAQMLDELAKILSVPPEFAPLLRQWKTLTHALSGLFATTIFGREVDYFLQLNPIEAPSMYGTEPSSFVNPKAVGEALRALGQVSHGKASHIYIAGEDSVAWFAAVAQWLFDLKIVVRSEQGEVLHINFQGESQPQITFTFSQSSSAKTSLQSEGEGGVYRLDSATPMDPESPSFWRSGRVEIDLRRVFGHWITKFLAEEAKTVGALMGSAIRMIHELVSISDAGIGSALVERAYGVLRNQVAAQHMGQFMKLTFHDARSTYVDEMAKLRRSCRCHVCSRSPRTDSSRKPGSEGPQSHQPGSYCRVAMFTTYMMLILLLCRTVISPEILAKRRGLLLFYERQVQKLYSARNDAGLHDLARFLHQYGDVLDPKLDFVLEASLELFSGLPIEAGTAHGFLGLSHEGVFVCDLRLEGPGRSGRQPGAIRVCFGKVEYQGKMFDRVRDGRNGESRKKTLPESLDNLKLSASDTKAAIRENGAELILLS